MNPENYQRQGVEQLVRFTGWLALAVGAIIGAAEGYQTVDAAVKRPSQHDYSSHSQRDPAFLAAQRAHAQEWSRHIDMAGMGAGIMVVGGVTFFIRWNREFGAATLPADAVETAPAPLLQAILPHPLSVPGLAARHLHG